MLITKNCFYISYHTPPNGDFKNDIKVVAKTFGEVEKIVKSESPDFKICNICLNKEIWWEDIYQIPLVKQNLYEVWDEECRDILVLAPDINALIQILGVNTFIPVTINHLSYPDQTLWGL